MKIQGTPRRSIEIIPGQRTVRILDQTVLPHEIEWRELATLEAVVEAIKVMRVRGAPLIGATAAYGYFFALRDDSSDATVGRLTTNSWPPGPPPSICAGRSTASAASSPPWHPPTALRPLGPRREPSVRRMCAPITPSVRMAWNSFARSPIGKLLAPARSRS